ncbi:Tetracycline resistance protein TetA/multidrug resistance protein MdtG [Penicillium pulvis]|uniref:Tetracycline resistance protein TetA/multidrug resistance protein MdtG n=1 Tax=Penicillium pulvis TaxID=1562058 RepID=UPI0025482624|nr:Tetracycline resistance protein TetA/multidrug resistance protein MdtG [Penicillium pulvis]KAJ5813806.1 Tetracycline resistance protein TetA/multidrug resistance protein MdtG [Penicillium pulvis]
MGDTMPIGYKWRSSTWFIVTTVAIALFSETFLYGFLVPILGHMLRTRLHIDFSKIQEFTSAVLALYGAAAVISGPIIGHFADKTSNRKIPLLLSLIGCILGTGMVAGAYSVTVLFIGRALQSVSGSAVWIVGLATVADAVDQDKMGRVMGAMNSFVNFGMISGPVVSGLLLDIAGYWITWSVPLLVLSLDLMARLLMVERTLELSSKPEDTTETTSLLSSEGNPPTPSTTDSFWRILLCDSRVLAVLLVTTTSAAVGTSFHATLPLYVQETFGWKSGSVGLMFSCLIFPSLVISPLAGWVRDRVGVRMPAVVSLILQAGALGMLGIGGNDQFAWASIHNRGEILYILSIIAIGTLRPFVSNIGTVELAGIVKAHQEKSPGIFGPEGGLSRVFSMTDVATSLGMAIGPVVSGSLKELVGYTYMNWTCRLL